MTHSTYTQDIPLSQKALGEYTFNDIRGLNCLPEIYVGKEITEVRATNLRALSGHSQGGILYFTGPPSTSSRKGESRIDRRLFAKMHGHTNDTSQVYSSRRNPHLLYARELQSSQMINNHVGKGIAPRVVGYNPENLIIFFEYVPYHSDRHRLIECIEQNDQKKQEEIIYRAHRSIACLGGQLEARARYFPPVLSDNRHTKTQQVQEMLDYVLAIAKHTNPEKAPDEWESLKEFANIRYGLDNIVHDVITLVDTRDALRLPRVFQHGDCRPQHLKSEDLKRDEGRRKYRPVEKLLVDWEQFGRHPIWMDHAMYAASEGAIGDLPLEHTLKLGGIIGAYRQASMKRIRKERKAAIRELDDLPPSHVARKTPEKLQHRFALGYLSNLLWEHVHLHASNNRYAPEHRQHFIDSIPDWSLERMMSERTQRMADILDYVDQEIDFSVMEHQEAGARAHFQTWQEFLQKLELINGPTHSRMHATC